MYAEAAVSGFHSHEHRAPWQSAGTHLPIDRTPIQSNSLSLASASLYFFHALMLG
jgi:hypothetical protein